MTIEEWARNQQERRRRFDDDARGCKLKPPEAFSDELASPEVFQRPLPRSRPGAHRPQEPCRPVAHCAKLLRLGTAADDRLEFYDAIPYRHTRPSAPEEHHLHVGNGGHLHGALRSLGAARLTTFRDLVRALHVADFPWPDRIAEINQWADPQLSRAIATVVRYGPHWRLASSLTRGIRRCGPGRFDLNQPLDVISFLE